MRYLSVLLVCIAVAASGAPALALNAEPSLKGACAKDRYKDRVFVVCRFGGCVDDIRLFLNNADGEPYSQFDKVSEALTEKGERLVFAMNAGMYDDERAPVGLYVEDYETLRSANTNPGPGNFHLLPNGVFWIADTGGVQAARVAATETYLSATDATVRYATQSGPMLVIDGDIHPRFLKDGTSRKRRNGVGVTEDGEVIFVLSDSFVTFYEFGSFFRDELKTPNALFLDGTISRIYAPELGRDDAGAAMGPIIGVVEKAQKDAE